MLRFNLFRKKDAPLLGAVGKSQSDKVEALPEQKAGHEAPIQLDQMALINTLVQMGDLGGILFMKLQSLLEHNADLRALDNNGRNIFHYFAQRVFCLSGNFKEYLAKHHEKDVRVLLESKDKDGNTPLHLMMIRRKVKNDLDCRITGSRMSELFELYKEFKADINVPNYLGFPSIFCLIDRADKFKEHELYQIFHMLFLNMVDCFHATMLTYVDGVKQQVTPAQYARIRGFDVAAEIIESFFNSSYKLSYFYHKQRTKAFLQGRDPKFADESCVIRKFPIAESDLNMIFSFVEPAMFSELEKGSTEQAEHTHKSLR